MAESPCKKGKKQDAKDNGTGNKGWADLPRVLMESMFKFIERPQDLIHTVKMVCKDWNLQRDSQERLLDFRLKADFPGLKETFYIKSSLGIHGWQDSYRYECRVQRAWKSGRFTASHTPLPLFDVEFAACSEQYLVLAGRHDVNLDYADRDRLLFYDIEAGKPTQLVHDCKVSNLNDWATMCISQGRWGSLVYIGMRDGSVWSFNPRAKNDLHRKKLIHLDQKDNEWMVDNLSVHEWHETTYIIVYWFKYLAAKAVAQFVIKEENFALFPVSDAEPILFRITETCPENTCFPRELPINWTKHISYATVSVGGTTDAKAQIISFVFGEGSGHPQETRFSSPYPRVLDLHIDEFGQGLYASSLSSSRNDCAVYFFPVDKTDVLNRYQTIPRHGSPPVYGVRSNVGIMWSTGLAPILMDLPSGKEICTLQECKYCTGSILLTHTKCLVVTSRTISCFSFV